MIKQRMLRFKKYFERKRKRWRVEFDEELDENINHRTVYFVITGDSLIDKQKVMNFSIFYVVSRKKDGLLDFRDEVNEFIKEDLTKVFQNEDCFNIGGYDVEYSIDRTRDAIRIAEIKCSFDYTTLREDTEEKIENMEVFDDKINMKE